MPANIATSSVNARDVGCVWTLAGLMLTALFTLGLGADPRQALAMAG